MLLCSMAFAQKPVRIDDILTQKNQIKLDSTFSYSNIQSSNNLGATQAFQTQNGDIVAVPAYFGTSKNNIDYLNLDLTLRYGALKDVELFASINGYNSNARYTLPSKLTNKNDTNINAFSIGGTYQIKPEGKTPSLLLGASTQIIEKTKVNDTIYTSKLKSFRVFATSFYSVDPVVFLVSASYSFHDTKTLGKVKRDDANIFTLSPQVYFAVNPYTSLNWGVKYNYFGKTKIDTAYVSNNGSNLSFVTGVSYEFSSKIFVSMNAEYLNTNSQSQNRFSITLSYTL